MNSNYKPMVALIVFIVFVAMIAVWPYAVFASVEILFGYAIPYSTGSVLAYWIIHVTVRMLTGATGLNRINKELSKN